MHLFGFPDILCSAKRLKLLMQPLSSIHVRTEALALTKLEVWWYLLMRLGPRLPSNFEQVTTQVTKILVPQPAWGLQLRPLSSCKRKERDAPAEKRCPCEKEMPLQKKYPSFIPSGL